MTYWTVLIDAAGAPSLADEVSVSSPSVDGTAVAVARFAAASPDHASAVYRELFAVSDRAGRLEWRRQVMRSR